MLHSWLVTAPPIGQEALMGSSDCPARESEGQPLSGEGSPGEGLDRTFWW